MATSESFHTRRQAAIDQMQQRRDRAFLFDTDSICDIPVNHLSLRLLLFLHQVGSVFVTNKWSPYMGENMATEIRCFLWLISTEYREDGIGRHAFRKRVDRLDSVQVLTEIRDYVAAAFADAPGFHDRDTTPYCSVAAQTCDHMATEYGWNVSELMNLPLAQLWQFRHCISARKEKNPIFFNRELDEFQRDFLKEQNSSKN